ncbi:MAG: hypothetical protein ACREJO_03125 [Phycisphaerales bacterium]
MTSTPPADLPDPAPLAEPVGGSALSPATVVVPSIASVAHTPPASAPNAYWGPVALGVNKEQPIKEGSGGGQVVAYAGIAVLVGIYFVYGLLLRSGLHLPDPMFLIPVGLGLGLIWVLYRLVRRVVRKVATTPRFPAVADPAARLRCIGAADEIVKFQALGEPRDIAFEPVVAFASLAVKMSTGAKTVLILITVAVCALMFVLREFGNLPLPRFGYFNVVTAIVIGSCAAVFLWPTYLRIVPGRIDILRYRLWNRKPTVETIDLRGANVLVNLHRSIVYIQTSDHARFWRTIGLGAVRNGREVAHAILQAAMSTVPTPPLPDDELIG